MTQLMQDALAKVQTLAPDEQDAIAQVILDELEDERRWTQSFAQSQDALGRLADKVRADIRAGKVQQIGMDEL